MPRKTRPQSREIEATRLILRDASGKVRILLDAGGKKGYASICIFSPDGRNKMEVGTQPGGAVVMSFGDERMDGMLTLSTAGMVLRAQDGRLGVVIGPVIDGRDDITVYHDGHPVWSSSQRKPPKKVRRSAFKHKRKHGGTTGP